MIMFGKRPRGLSGKNLRHAEVCENDMTLARKEDVCRFDVPMYNATRMQNFQSTYQLGHVEASEGDGYVATAKVKVTPQISLV